MSDQQQKKRAFLFVTKQGREFLDSVISDQETGLKDTTVIDLGDSLDDKNVFTARYMMDNISGREGMSGGMEHSYYLGSSEEMEKLEDHFTQGDHMSWGKRDTLQNWNRSESPQGMQLSGMLDGGYLNPDPEKMKQVLGNRMPDNPTGQQMKKGLLDVSKGVDSYQKALGQDKQLWHQGGVKMEDKVLNLDDQDKPTKQKFTIGTERRQPPKKDDEPEKKDKKPDISGMQ